MKKVLITGANSYVGTNVEKWLMKEPDKYYVETLDMKDPNWKGFDFSKFDVVFHVAGIAHVSTKKNMKDLYFKVNRDLAIETAIKAKTCGAKHFIFMSSLIVYSSKEHNISNDTLPLPDNFYGESKLQAEEELKKIMDSEFKLTIIRPPFIYGPGSKGNYIKLRRYILNSFIMPSFQNSRSSLYINNLTNFIEIVISDEIPGTFIPRDSTSFSTYKLSKLLSKIHNKKIFYTSIFNPIIKVLSKNVSYIHKIYGNVLIDYQNENIERFVPVSFERGIYETEKKI
jgi:UDP-glucose 4-epimerase